MAIWTEQEVGLGVVVHLFKQVLLVRVVVDHKHLAKVLFGSSLGRRHQLGHWFHIDEIAILTDAHDRLELVHYLGNQLGTFLLHLN